MSKILDSSQSYTFSKIFDLKIEPDELAAEFGYRFQRARLNLPQYAGDLPTLADLHLRLESVMPQVSLSSEASRREVLISQVLLDVVRHTKAELKVEYPIKVTEQLQGILDYLLRCKSELLVIEAKREDLDYGFTQLMTEMIALDQWDRTPNQAVLIGAVTTGEIWRFGRLERETKLIQQGLDLYRVPDDLDAVMRILIYPLIT